MGTPKKVPTILGNLQILFQHPLGEQDEDEEEESDESEDEEFRGMSWNLNYGSRIWVCEVNNRVSFLQ